MRRLLLTGASGFIGTNLLENWRGQYEEILNLDVRPPLDAAHQSFWLKADLLLPAEWNRRIADFQPTEVIHLAARTDMDEKTTPGSGYRVNIEGTRNLLHSLANLSSVQRFILISSQFVCGPAHIPRHDTDYAPVTVYGQSKVEAEKVLRHFRIPFPWIIARPTNVWGPWHPRYPQEFWKVLQKGWYVHPSGSPVRRAYAFVDTVLHQLQQILSLPGERVAGQTFYLSDPVDDIAHWVDAFSCALRGRPARRIPRQLLFALGRAGDAIEALTRQPFYLNSSRARSMTTDYVVPLDKSLAILGRGPISLEGGVKRTVTWLRESYPDLFFSAK
ncbi:MAG: NAD(P)-dependent oxidoreductase [Verrucomicrobia bacterium]|nr:NAD(P)-dependent oxidoreductase [Verrucomicrobiota bacterium]NBS79421.1 NAD(P)-dependent oxidoreductase [bacterium]NBT23624.1 NAD(P)-dependent oxidoreductase [bacterium]NBV96808.1 NAD(P)-dependent oxidoreductase [Verrucomicrobiota bacterium]